MYRLFAFHQESAGRADKQQACSEQKNQKGRFEVFHGGGRRAKGGGLRAKGEGLRAKGGERRAKG